MRKPRSWSLKMTQKLMKKGRKHQLYLQGTLTSHHTGCLPLPPPSAIGNKAFAPAKYKNYRYSQVFNIISLPTNIILTRYHVPTTRLSSTPYYPLEDSFSSTTVETVTTSTASYDTVASEAVDTVDAVASEVADVSDRESDVISVVHFQGTKPVTSI